MLEKLKDLEQEAMDELTPEEYMAITHRNGQVNIAKDILTSEL